VKQVLAKADVEAQEQFKIETLEPLVEQAQQGHLQLFLVDAADFVFLPFWRYLYSLVVRYIKCASGRNRYNVLGALNAVSKALITVTHHAYINAEAVCTLPVCLRQKFPRDRLVLVMDNARYHRYNETYPNYDTFCQAIADCLTQTNTTHKAALDTLLVPKFQTFENVCFLP